MQRFLKFILLTFFLAFGIINAPVMGKWFCLLSNPAKDVYEIIARSIRKHPKKKILLLGDSVCRQVFGKKSTEDTLNMCENQAYEIPGNYILLKNLISQENSFDSVILYFNPFSLKSGLDQVFTYNYFVKPFRPYISQLEEKEIKYIKHAFPEKSSFDFLPSVKYHFSNWQLDSTVTINAVSEISIKYLKKMEQLCQDKKMPFRFKSLPVKSSRRKEVNEISQNSKQYISNSTILAKYFDHISYLPDSLFLDDVHYLHPGEIKIYQ